jgi:hypothetical protein
MPRAIATKPAGEAAFSDLKADTQEDVALRLATTMNLGSDEVLVLLDNGTILPLVYVKPAQLGTWPVSEAAVEEYAEVWRTGEDRFPPIVVDSSNREEPLQEGGHRTVAAREVGIEWIKAIDIAHPKIVRRKDPYSGRFYEVIEFEPRKRRR